MHREHLNPAFLPQDPVYSQVVVVRRPDATIYVGGQHAVTVEGEIVGDGLREQTVQALRNVQAALAAAGADTADVVRWTIAVVAGHPVEEGIAAFTEALDPPPQPPTLVLHVVAGLSDPRFLVEIDAIAVR
jgi:enamine deaminase RidA (YjgF/YER057c/UK114 family)